MRACKLKIRSSQAGSARENMMSKIDKFGTKTGITMQIQHQSSKISRCIVLNKILHQLKKEMKLGTPSRKTTKQAGSCSHVIPKAFSNETAESHNRHREVILFS
jgi:hypothetical protein